MAVLIEEQIDSGNFEIVRNQIGIILAEEIYNQLDISGNDMHLGIFLERTIPIDNSEEAVINISVANVDYQDHNLVSMQGSYNFFIDVYAVQIDSPYKVQTLLNYIRYILSNQRYRTLDFAPGFIGGTYVNSFEIETKLLAQDSDFTRTSRLMFNVRIMESENMNVGENFYLNETNYKICESELGYKVILKNE